MKISFFKDESYFYPRTSYFWKNAEQVKPNKTNGKTLKIYHSIFNWVFFILISGYVSISRLLSNQKNILGFILIPFIILPLHEFCHILYALIIKKKVIGIRFFPFNHGFTWSKPGAYVKLDFCVMKKVEWMLLLTFPLILLTSIPLLLAIIIPSIRIYMVYTAFISIGYASADIFNTIQISRIPRNVICFIECCWLIPTSDQPISIHRMRKIRDTDTLQYEQWLFADHQLIKVDEPEIDESVQRFVGEFQAQFGANCHI